MKITDRFLLVFLDQNHPETHQFEQCHKPQNYRHLMGGLMYASILSLFCLVSFQHCNWKWYFYCGMTNFNTTCAVVWLCECSTNVNVHVRIPFFTATNRAAVYFVLVSLVQLRVLYHYYEFLDRWTISIVKDNNFRIDSIKFHRTIQFAFHVCLCLVLQAPLKWIGRKFCADFLRCWESDVSLLGFIRSSTRSYCSSLIEVELLASPLFRFEKFSFFFGLSIFQSKSLMWRYVSQIEV